MKKRKIFLISAIAVLVMALIIGAVYSIFVYLPERQKRQEQERMVAAYYAEKLDRYQTENEQYADYEVEVAFLGDSLTDGYDLERYYPQYITANRGIGGETTHGLEKRLQVSAYDLKPKVVVMLIGGNNLDTMFENYENILTGLQKNLPESKVILVSLTAMGRDWAHKNQIAAYNNVKIQKLAQKYGYDFVDMFTPLFDLSTGEIVSDYTNDGVHLTHEGYQVFTQKLTSVIEKNLNP